MNGRIISTLLLKDLKLYFANRFFAFITVLGLVFFVAIYLLMPNDVDETLVMGMVAPDNLPTEMFAEMEENGLTIEEAATEADLRTAIAAGDYSVGIILPDDFLLQLMAGEQPQANIFFTADFPVELRETYAILVQEVAYAVSGRQLEIDVTEEILGFDTTGDTVPYRDRLVPLLAFAILMMETLGLASLISSEVETGTLRALLVTPLRVEGLFVSKGLLGVGMAFSQVLLLMVVTGGLSQRPLLIVVTLLLGSLLITGIAFLIASVARDMMSVMGWGVLIMLLLFIPALAVLIPGLLTSWVRLIPSYYLIETINQAANYNVGWDALGQNLLILLLISIVALGLGVTTLRRKFT